jgi:hypothetical protein
MLKDSQSQQQQANGIVQDEMKGLGIITLQLFRNEFRSFRHAPI